MRLSQLSVFCYSFGPHSSLASSMRFQAILGLFFAATASAHPGLLHDEPHHTHEVLDNIHQTPHCAYICYFDEDYQQRWAGSCLDIAEGLEKGACFCRSDAYQYIVDQCYSRKCSPGDRKKVNLVVCSETNVRRERWMRRVASITGLRRKRCIRSRKSKEMANRQTVEVPWCWIERRIPIIMLHYYTGFFVSRSQGGLPIIIHVVPKCHLDLFSTTSPLSLTIAPIFLFVIQPHFLAWSSHIESRKLLIHS